MNCPKCGFQQSKKDAQGTCMRCGVVFQKFEEHQTKTTGTPPPAPSLTVRARAKARTFKAADSVGTVEHDLAGYQKREQRKWRVPSGPMWVFALPAVLFVGWIVTSGWMSIRMPKVAELQDLYERNKRALKFGKDETVDPSVAQGSQNRNQIPNLVTNSGAGPVMETGPSSAQAPTQNTAPAPRQPASIPPAYQSTDPCSGKVRCVTLYVAPWCPACKSTLPTAKALQARWANSNKIGIRILVGAAPTRESQSLVDDLGRFAQVDPDDQFRKQTAITQFPTWMIQDSDGRELDRRAAGIAGPAEQTIPFILREFKLSDYDTQ